MPSFLQSLSTLLTKALVWALVGLGSLFIVSCGLSKDSSSITSPVDGACVNEQLNPITVFGATLHPLLTQSCASCHGDSPQAPSLFATSSFSKAYGPAKSNVSFSNPQSSLLVAKMNQAHNCGGKCAELAAGFKLSIDAWKKAEDEASLPLCTAKVPTDTPAPTLPPGTIITSVKTIPPSLTATAETTLVWNLSDLKSDLNGVYLRISVKRGVASGAGTLGTFVVSKVTLGTSQKKIKIDSLGFRMNGVDTTYNNFQRINFVTAPQPFDPNAAVWPFFNVSRFAQDIAFERAAGDGLQLIFNIGESTLPASPDPVAAPETEVQFFNRAIGSSVANGGVLTTNCRSCHNSAGDAGTAGTATNKFNLTGTDITTWRTNAITKVNGNDAAQSLILENAGGTNHPFALDVTSTAFTNLQAWVQLRATAPSP